jgi:hypothetical protein
MPAVTKNLTNLAIGLARELPYLRPSQQRKISQLLETPEQVWIFSKAVELALQGISAENDEVLERVYLLGLEVRQIFDARSATNLHLAGHWENISAQVIAAFAGGFRRDPFDRTLDAVHSIRSRESKSSEPASYQAYAISDAEIVTVLNREETGRVVN